VDSEGGGGPDRSRENAFIPSEKGIPTLEVLGGQRKITTRKEENWGVLVLQVVTEVVGRLEGAGEIL